MESVEHGSIGHRVALSKESLVGGLGRIDYDHGLISKHHLEYRAVHLGPFSIRLWRIHSDPKLEKPESDKPDRDSPRLGVPVDQGYP